MGLLGDKHLNGDVLSSACTATKGFPCSLSLAYSHYPMCLYYQPPDETAETVNLSQKVSIATPEETPQEETPQEETPQEETEEEKPLPEWSEKVASGILTGKAKQLLQPEISLGFSCLAFILKGSV